MSSCRVCLSISLSLRPARVGSSPLSQLLGGARRDHLDRVAVLFAHDACPMPREFVQLGLHLIARGLQRIDLVLDDEGILRAFLDAPPCAASVVTFHHVLRAAHRVANRSCDSGLLGAHRRPKGKTRDDRPDRITLLQSHLVHSVINEKNNRHHPWNRARAADLVSATRSTSWSSG